MKASKQAIIGLSIATALVVPQLVFQSLTSVASSRVVETQPVPIQVEVNLDASLIAQKVNDYRATKGLAPLAMSEQLNAAACAKADHMLANQYWAHDSPDGVTPWSFFDQAGYDYQLAGENLAFGFQSEGAVVDGWIASPGHERNMVGNYAEQGMCVRHGSLMGEQTFLVVNHFGLR